ncbi:MAG TPA: AMIN domain-containing protein, partial [Gammaproteobacteria bacterium]|nr:AMIN domain-containing protein [Gammaproteobacteria bacterium]
MFKKERLIFIFVIQLLFIGVAHSTNVVNGIRIWDSPESTRFVFDLTQKANYHAFRLDKPHRIVVDLKQARLRGKIPYIKRSHALVKNLRSAERNNHARRFVIDTKGRLKYHIFTLPPNKKYGHRLVIELNSAHHEKNLSKSKRTVSRNKQSGLRDVIVAIDAGHGGEDPGAIGYYGTREKNITLTIARKIKKMLDKQKGMHAVLIRKGDYYIPLRKRIDIARKAKADMFISIHADAFRNPKVKGSSVYVLSERGATDEATKWLEDQENSADLVGGVVINNKDKTLAMVLLDLSQAATIEASTRVANNVLTEIQKIAPVHKKTVQQARFVVLKSPDIPSLLVETAFISNPREEKRLRNNRYQNTLAKSILRGVQKYFNKNPPPDTYLARKHSKFNAARRT